MEWGDQINFLMDVARADGAIPTPLRDRPKLASSAVCYWEAFCSLSTDRPGGMGVMPIPWSSIDRYARRHGIEGEDFDRLAKLVMAVDAAWMKAVNDKRERDKPNG